MATATTEKATSKTSAKEKAKPVEPTVEPTAEEQKAAEEAAAAAEAQKAAEALRQEHDEQLEILEPKADPRRWVIGKPPENGGTEDEYSVYIQRPLGYMTRMRFFALVSNTIADAIKSGGSISFGGSDPFSTGSGSIRERVGALGTEDFADAASFMTLAMQLIGYAPDFMLDCYVLWLDVPTSERHWAKLVMEQDRDPERNKWGLDEDMAIEMVEVFIDQNYDDIRNFFTGKLPRLAQRVREREAARKGRESELAQSKQ